MKWWYVFVIIIGVFVGGWVWGKYGEKRSAKLEFVEGNRVDEEISKNSTMIIPNRDGKKVEVIQVVGKVRSWDFEKGVLEFSQNNKIWRVKIDLSRTMMFVNSLKFAGNSISVEGGEDPNWKGGFCPGDEVVLRLNGEEVVFVINNGYRYCGFKGK